MKHNDLVLALKHIRPNAEWVLSGDELQWLDTKQTKPTEIEIEQGLIDYEAKLEADKLQAIANKTAAEAKLKALGLTADDLAALGL